MRGRLREHFKKGPSVRWVTAVSASRPGPRTRPRGRDSQSRPRIRTLASADRGEWVRLRSELWPRSRVDFLSRDADALLRSHRAGRFRRNRMRATVFVAELGHGKLVGFAEADLRPYADGCRSSPVGYLEGWYVAPELRRTGIGSALVRAVEKWARDLGCTEMASDTETTNSTSQLAHKSLGYTEVRRLAHFRRDLPVVKLKRET